MNSPSTRPTIHTPTGADTRGLRNVLGHVPTSVAVVCTLDGRDPVGHTIGSFVSVSLDPPLVGYFAMRASATLEVVSRSGVFSVNILSEDQVALGQLFSHGSDDRFNGVRWEPGSNGCPHLDGALVSLDCEVDRLLMVGDHEMVLGRVTAATAHLPALGPLVFAGGKFCALSSTSRGPTVAKALRLATRRSSGHRVAGLNGSSGSDATAQRPA